MGPLPDFRPAGGVANTARRLGRCLVWFATRLEAFNYFSRELNVKLSFGWMWEKNRPLHHLGAGPVKRVGSIGYVKFGDLSVVSDGVTFSISATRP